MGRGSESRPGSHEACSVCGRGVESGLTHDMPELDACGPERDHGGVSERPYTVVGWGFHVPIYDGVGFGRGSMYLAQRETETKPHCCALRSHREGGELRCEEIRQRCQAIRQLTGIVRMCQDGIRARAPQCAAAIIQRCSVRGSRIGIQATHRSPD